jgi:hypothetical protein
MPRIIKGPKRIAPRLWGGASRIGWGGRLPEHIKEGLRKIARTENKSMSWVLEEVVIEFFNLDRPRYVNDPEQKPHTVNRKQSEGASKHGDLQATR